MSVFKRDTIDRLHFKNGAYVPVTAWLSMGFVKMKGRSLEKSSRKPVTKSPYATQQFIAILMASELGEGWGMSAHPGTLLVVTVVQPQGCLLPSLDLPSPHSSSCIPLELGVTTASLACCWLTNWYGLQISVRYCLKMQLLVPQTWRAMWSARVLPEGHPRWPASLLSGPTVRKREEILTEYVQEKMFISVPCISKHPSFEVENHK